MASRHFARGSSTFPCECCQRRTRITTQDDTRFCGECYDLLGIQNSMWDDGVQDWMTAPIIQLTAKIAKLGGDLLKVRAFIPQLFERVGV